MRRPIETGSWRTASSAGAAQRMDNNVRTAIDTISQHTSKYVTICQLCCQHTLIVLSTKNWGFTAAANAARSSGSKIFWNRKICFKDKHKRSAFRVIALFFINSRETAVYAALLARQKVSHRLKWCFPIILSWHCIIFIIPYNKYVQSIADMYCCQYYNQNHFLTQLREVLCHGFQLYYWQRISCSVISLRHVRNMLNNPLWCFQFTLTGQMPVPSWHCIPGKKASGSACWQPGSQARSAGFGEGIASAAK